MWYIIYNCVKYVLESEVCWLHKPFKCAVVIQASPVALFVVEDDKCSMTLPTVVGNSVSHEFKRQRIYAQKQVEVSIT
jgi:hypothetical protein